MNICLTERKHVWNFRQFIYYFIRTVFPWNWQLIFGKFYKIFNPLIKEDVFIVISLFFIYQKQTLLWNCFERKERFSGMDERRVDRHGCKLHPPSCLPVAHLRCLQMFIQRVLLAFVSSLFVYLLRTNPWRWGRALSKMWLFFKFWEYTGESLSPNKDLGLCVIFIYIWCLGSFLLWIIETWLNMSTTQLNITLWGKFILALLCLFIVMKREGERKNTRDSTGCNFNRSFQPVLTFTKFW